MEIEVLYEDKDVLVINKPSGVVVFPEKIFPEKTLIDLLLGKFPYLKKVGKPHRYGIVHRLDKDTSGILLVAKNNKALDFLQKQFQNRKVIKKYLALIVGNLKTNQGKIETLIGRSPKNRKKQKVFSFYTPEAKRKGLRIAITEYKILERFKDYTFLEAIPKTGRKHQIRCHFSYLGYPIVGDKLYSFKSQPKPVNLKRHFLHASYLKIKLPNDKEKEFKKEFKIDLPKDLKEVLENLEPI